MNKEQKNEAIIETLKFAAITACCCCLAAGVFALIGKFDMNVLLGFLIGFVVCVGNFLFMALTLMSAAAGIENTVVKKENNTDDLTENKGNESESPADADTEDKSANATVTQISPEAAKAKSRASLLYMVRMLLLAGALVLAIILTHCNIIALMLPLLFSRPVMLIEEFIRKAGEKNGRK